MDVKNENQLKAPPSAEWLDQYKTSRRRRRSTQSHSSSRSQAVRNWKARRSRKRQMRIALISIVMLVSMSISLYVMLSRREAASGDSSVVVSLAVNA
jgi:uncharacterized membrane protein YbaN (DUF454 family)